MMTVRRVQPALFCADWIAGFTRPTAVEVVR